MLAIEQFLKVDYRGPELFLRDRAGLRQALVLEKDPDRSSLQ